MKCSDIVKLTQRPDIEAALWEQGKIDTYFDIFRQFLYQFSSE